MLHGSRGLIGDICGVDGGLIHFQFGVLGVMTFSAHIVCFGHASLSSNDLFAQLAEQVETIAQRAEGRGAAKDAEHGTHAAWADAE